MNKILKIKVVVHSDEINNILKKAHVNRENEHFSKKIAYDTLKLRYEWDSMYRDVCNFINICQCEYSKKK